MTNIEALEHDRPPTPLDRRRFLWLVLAIGLPPLLWNLQLLVLSAFANYACFPGDTPLSGPAESMGWVTMLEWLVSIAAIVIAISCGFVSLRYWQLATNQIRAHEGDGFARWHLDRLCFMALGGILSSGGFLVAILFQAIVTIMVPPCA